MASGSVAQQKTSGIIGNRSYQDYTGTINGGQTVEIINFSIPVGEYRALHILSFHLDAYAVVNIYDDASKIGSLRASPASPNPSFIWAGGRKVEAGHIVKVEVISEADNPDGCQIDSFLQMTDAQ